MGASPQVSLICVSQPSFDRGTKYVSRRLISVGYRQLAPDLQLAYTRLVQTIPEEVELDDGISVAALSDNVILRKADLRRCAPGQWIGDAIINAMATLLQV